MLKIILLPEDNINVRNMCWRRINNPKINSLVDLFILKYMCVCVCVCVFVNIVLI